MKAVVIAIALALAGRFTQAELKSWEPLNDIIPVKEAV